MCFNDRRSPAVIVSVLSGIAGALGVLMMVQTFMFHKNDSFLTAKIGGSYQEYFDYFNLYSYVVLLVISSLAILLGICGVGCCGSCCIN